MGGAWDAAGSQVSRVVISAGAGAVGQVGAGRVASAASFLSRQSNTVRGAEVVNTAVNVVGNLGVGAGVGGSSQFARNVATGDDGSIVAATIGGAVGGAASPFISLPGRGSAQLLSDSTGDFIATSSGGVAAPLSRQGAKEPALEVGAAAAATALEQYISCGLDDESC